MQLIEKIQKLKSQRNAVILAHNYQVDEVQDIADFTGDSLGLSIEASKTDADVIVFCGVHFMAETAAILSPKKTVLLPDLNAGCPMADMINAKQLTELKAKYPEAVVVSYVNSTAEVKALSDYCCTSSNAVDLVKAIPADKQIIFVPDQHLGGYVIEQTGRDMILYPGYCSSHARIMAQDVLDLKEQHPQAIVLAHPECNEEVKKIADEKLSTGHMLKCAKQSQATEFIIATEPGIIHSLKKQNPGKMFYPATMRAICPNMKKITLEKVLWSLEEMKHVIKVPDAMATKARAALERMISVVPK